MIYRNQPLQSWEVFRAIEKKDLVFLMEVRDHAFHVSSSLSSADTRLLLTQVLLKKSGDATPLVHSMRIGKSHSEVTIDLLGAISRWVNHLPDEEVNLPETKVLLRALRESETVVRHLPYLLVSAQGQI